MKQILTKILILLFSTTLIAGCTGISANQNQEIPSTVPISDAAEEYSLLTEEDVPYIELNNNIPNFTEEEKNNTEVFEIYSELDELNRCGTAYANLHVSNMPTEERESIGMIKPSGWITSKYDFIDGKYLYNRCHLIGYQLAGENANEQNLITGTRYLNVEGMLPFENQVADYLKETGNHVLYRVTPHFEGEELVARGVEIEAYSVEDEGEGIQFHVYCFNIQPNVEIDYATGENKEALSHDTSENESDDYITTYIINNNSKKFHDPDCANADKIAEKNKEVRESSIQRLMEEGYEPAKCCIDQ